MDEYIRDVIDSRKMLIVEEAVDQDLEYEDLCTCADSVADKFVDGFITDEEMSAALEEDELNRVIDDLVDDVNIEELILSEPDTIPDDDGELSEINAALDSDIDPEVLDLEIDDDMYFEDDVD